ncbi:NAD-dependent epimerase/dehydratase family protein [Chloroflexota bacterium]
MSAIKILVTGVGGYWGEHVAQSLAKQPFYHVMGLDTVAPKEPIPGLDFIQADICNPLLVDLFKSEQVKIVCHLAFKESIRPSESTFDHNVMGTMKVLGACVESGVEKIILRSSIAVYGAKALNSAYLTEEAPLAGSRAYGSIRDLLEIEAFCNGFRGQYPEKVLTVLRFANIIGPSVDSPMTKFLRERLSPSLLGFDPMMQLIHEDDVVNSILHSIENDFSGAYNVAAQDLLPLSKVIGLAGKTRFPVFHPFAYWGYSMIGGSGLRLSRHIPIELDYIRYRCVGDIKKMQEVFQYDLTITAEEALREFSELNHEKRYLPEAVSGAAEVDNFKRIIERRSQNISPQKEEPLAENVEGMEGNYHE